MNVAFAADMSGSFVGLFVGAITSFLVMVFVIPFDEGLTVQACKLDACEGACPHLFHGLWWSGNEGGNIAVFNAIKIGLDGLGSVPWRGE